MGIIGDLLTGKLWQTVVSGAKWVWDRLVQYQAGQDAIREGELQVQLAELKAREGIAAYKVKADLEWDLKWADAAQHSWKDEYLLILWSLPIIGLFLPFWGIRDTIISGFDYMRQFNSDAPNWYLAGWAIIFAATFGMRQALQFMLPGRVAALAGVLGSSNNPDIPMDAMKAIDDRIKAATN